MTDVVVTVPKSLWEEWCKEGDAAYSGSTRHTAAGLPRPWDERAEYGFNLYGGAPLIKPGERVYIVAHGKLRGYAPLVEVEPFSTCFGGNGHGYALVRRGDAVAVTIDEPIRGFQGFRYRWWELSAEKAFPGWRKP